MSKQNYGHRHDDDEKSFLSYEEHLAKERLNFQENEEQSTSNTSTLTTGQKFWLELKAQPYNEDRVGQAEVMNFSRTVKKKTIPTDNGTEK